MSTPDFEDRAPTTDRLRADIDAGRTGDKVPARDPAASPLGTDDEAAGRPPGPARRALAAEQERGRFGGAGASWKPDREGNHSVVYVIAAAILVTVGAVGAVAYLMH